MKVLSRTVSIVKGGIPADEHKVMYLSGADHFVRPGHIPLYHFYEAQVGGEPVLPMEVLLKSLKQLLFHFPPLSGRLRRKPNTSSKYELDCNDAGAEFVEVTVDGRLSDFGDFQPSPLYNELLNPVPAVLGDIFERSVMYAQVTRFACGGAALVTSGNHTVVDGLSARDFITAWSELARGLELSSPPVHDRTLMKSTVAPDPNFKLKELRPIGDTAAVVPKRNISDSLTARRFAFSPAQLKKLKAKASEDGVVWAFSTFESVSAHVWQSITKARCPDPTANTKFLTTLDVRRRVKPNLPEGYFGNAIYFAIATTTAGEIVKQPLSYAAGLIRDVISEFNDDRMRSLVAFVEHFDEPVTMNLGTGKDGGNDIAVGNWFRMQFQETDFGSGKPLVASSGMSPHSGSVFILPGQSDGYMNVFITLKTEHMLMLEGDAEFLLETSS